MSLAIWSAFRDGPGQEGFRSENASATVKYIRQAAGHSLYCGIQKHVKSGIPSSIPRPVRNMLIVRVAAGRTARVNCVRDCLYLGLLLIVKGQAGRKQAAKAKPGILVCCKTQSCRRLVDPARFFPRWPWIPTTGGAVSDPTSSHISIFFFLITSISVPATAQTAFLR